LIDCLFIILEFWVGVEDIKCQKIDENRSKNSPQKVGSGTAR